MWNIVLQAQKVSYIVFSDYVYIYSVYIITNLYYLKTFHTCIYGKQEISLT